ncbi:MAG: hypothetical protein KKC68_08305 [Candidatus Thermoplasmatota archaeon]|nr:hypothetical protein [Candidatus Thermoplasmatota archaeon]MBU1941761.1 hypothetical protein [Candidatus Thermoplasmatota archaeon]
MKITDDMKLFARRIVGFGLVLFVVFGLLNIGYYHLILSNTVLERSYSDFLEHRENIRILFMGDSHPKRDINPALINYSFNLADVGESYIQTYHKLSTVLNDPLVDLYTVVLPLDLHSFSSMRTDRIKNEWYWDRFIQYDEVFSQDTNRSIFDSVVWRFKSWFPIISKGQELIEYAFVRRESSELVKGYIISYDNYSMSSDKSIWAFFRAQSQLEDSEIMDPILVEYFKKCLILCTEQNLHIILIKYPISEHYYTAVHQFIPNLSLINDTIETIITEFPGVIMLDYQDFFFGRDDVFMDTDHLNKKGADLFTSLIRNDFKNITTICDLI